MTTWKAPKGYTLEVHPGHQLNGRGYRIEDGDQNPRGGVMPDGQIEVLWFDEDEPFVQSENDGRGPMASAEAIAAARAGKPLSGWNPNTHTEPIKDGWVPPTYILRKDGDA